MAKFMTLESFKREIVDILLEKKKQDRSAGVIVVKRGIHNEQPSWLYLALIKETGKYDITKGIIDPGESDIECALREAQEEANINLSEANFAWGTVSISYGRGVAFVAECDQEPKVLPNPETGVLEHVGVKWVSLEEMVENVSDFLVPAVVWSHKVITGDVSGDI